MIVRYFPALIIIFLLTGCGQESLKVKITDPEQKSDTSANIKSRSEINTMLDSFNTAAANADFNKYFNFYTADAIFIGTDATENWNKYSFMIWAKPFFDKGKAWNFSTLGRNIYFDKSGQLAWFDELLKTQMKICRGSGVVVKQNGDWKVQQYVLSMTIPNNLADSVVAIKTTEEDKLMQTLIK